MKGIFALLDLKAAAYGMPFVHDTPGTAERQLVDWMRQEDSVIKDHPEDYTLCFLGEYDPGSGTITPSANGPRPLVNALQLKAQLEAGTVPLRREA